MSSKRNQTIAIARFLMYKSGLNRQLDGMSDEDYLKNPIGLDVGQYVDDLMKYCPESTVDTVLRHQDDMIPVSYTHLPEFVTQEQMGEICGICKKTAYTLVYSGKIPYTVETNRLGRTHRIKLTDVLLYLYEKECRQEPVSYTHLYPPVFCIFYSVKIVITVYTVTIACTERLVKGRI